MTRAARIASKFSTSESLASYLADPENTHGVITVDYSDSCEMSEITTTKFFMPDGSVISVCKVDKNPGFGRSYISAYWANGDGLRHKNHGLERSYID